MFKLFAAFLIWAIRGFCTWRGRVRVIRRPATHAEKYAAGRSDCGEPYLIRYALFGWLPGDKRRASCLPNIYLHNILLPDSDTALHNHPWPWAWSLILSGVYAEDRQSLLDDTQVYGPGDVNRLSASTFHRIANVSGNGMPGTCGERGVWTLFITSGGKRQPWGFSVPGVGFVPHAMRKLYKRIEANGFKPEGRTYEEHPAIVKYMQRGYTRAQAKEMSFAERHPPTGLKIK